MKRTVLVLLIMLLACSVIYGETNQEVIEKIIIDHGGNLVLLKEDFPNQEWMLINQTPYIVFNVEKLEELKRIAPYSKTLAGKVFEDKYGIDYVIVQERQGKEEIISGQAIDEHDAELLKKLSAIKQSDFFKMKSPITINFSGSQSKLTADSFKLFVICDVIHQRSFFYGNNLNPPFVREYLSDSSLYDSYNAVAEILDCDHVFQLIEDQIVVNYNHEIYKRQSYTTFMSDDNSLLDSGDYWPYFLSYVLPEQERLSLFKYLDEFQSKPSCDSVHSFDSNTVFEMNENMNVTMKMHEPLFQVGSKIEVSEDLAKYKDIDINSAYIDAIRFCVKEKIFEGNQNNLNPKGKINKAELATVLVKYLRLEDHKKDNGFSDTIGQWYHSYMEIARENNLLSGNTDGTSGAHDDVTIAMAYAVFSNLIENPVKAPSYYPNHWSRDAAYTLVLHQVINEKEALEGLIQPNKSLKREEVMDLIMRYVNREPLKSYEVIESSLDEALPKNVSIQTPIGLIELNVFTSKFQEDLLLIHLETDHQSFSSKGLNQYANDLIMETRELLIEEMNEMMTMVNIATGNKMKVSMTIYYSGEKDEIIDDTLICGYYNGVSIDFVDNFEQE